MSEEQKPIERMSFSELKDEHVRLNNLLKKNTNYKGITLAMLKTDIRKWRKIEAEGDNPTASEPEEERNSRGTKAGKELISKGKVKDEPPKESKSRIIRAMGASGTKSSDIIKMHEEGKTATEIVATDPENLKYNTVSIIIKRYIKRQFKVQQALKKK